MKHQKSVFIIVAISLFVGLLHFVTGPGYQGLFRHFVRGYLMDILLPLNLYLLLQLSLRKHLSVRTARITGALFTFAFGTTVELFQFYGIEFFGRTFDPWDLLMYGIGTGAGIALDLTLIDQFEKERLKNE